MQLNICRTKIIENYVINRDSATENRISGNGKKSQIPGWTYFDNISAGITVKHDGSMYEVTKYVVSL